MKKYLILSMICLFLAGAVVPARASIMAADEDVREAIRSVEQRIQDAREVVSHSNHEKAHEALTQAREAVQQAARELERENIEQAMRYVRRAMEMVQMATQLARQSLSTPAGLEPRDTGRLLNRLEENVLQTEQIVSQSNNEQAASMLEQAKQKAEQAIDLHEKRSERATLQAISQAERLLSLVRQEVSRGASSQAHNDALSAILAEVDALLADLHEVDVSAPAENVQEAVAKAAQLRQRAQAALEKNDHQRALHEAQRALQLLQWVHQQTSGSNLGFSAEDRALREFERTQDMLHGLLQIISADGQLQQKLETQQQLLDDAKDQYEQGNAHQALEIIARVQQNLLQIQYQLDHPGQPDDSNVPSLERAAREEYQYLVNGILRDAFHCVKQARLEMAIRSYEKAQKAAEQAKHHIERQQYQLALQSIEVSRTWARLAIDQCRNSITPGPINVNE